jgi:hypothetical protein
MFLSTKERERGREEKRVPEKYNFYVFSWFDQKTAMKGNDDCFFNQC